MHNDEYNRRLARVIYMAEGIRAFCWGTVLAAIIWAVLKFVETP